jgi:hypothetical protein
LIAKHDLIRTTRQNNLYWGIYVPTCADYFGYFPEEMHEEFKLMFNPKDSVLTPKIDVTINSVGVGVPQKTQTGTTYTVLE